MFEGFRSLGLCGKDLSVFNVVLIESMDRLKAQHHVAHALALGLQGFRGLRRLVWL